MRNSRFLFILLFTAILISGKARHCAQSEVYGHVFKKKPSTHYLSNSISDDKDNDGNGLKRKIRPKGVEVIVPHIDRISFDQTCTRHLVFPLPSDRIYSSFLHCVNRKRGPPLA